MSVSFKGTNQKDSDGKRRGLWEADVKNTFYYVDEKFYGGIRFYNFGQLWWEGYFNYDLLLEGECIDYEY